MKKLFSAILAVLGLAISGCASGLDVNTSPNNTAITQVIDVRTAAEYASGHVAGAVNFDVEAGNFETQIATLDDSGIYLVYCRSGRRSAIAAAKMEKVGLTVFDGGALEAMVENGWPLGQ